ncbi:MAG: hypothetical protein J6W23_14100 [Victivallales bacterium]|nr:hypothetical protein [Victivallales bacterium]
MFRKIIRQFVILLFLSCCVMSTAQPSADELSAMMAEDVTGGRRGTVRPGETGIQLWCQGG